jgi:hypothetical protein
MEIFNGPVGIFVVIGVIVVFIQSFSWKKPQPVDPDAELGRAVRRVFKLL